MQRVLVFAALVALASAFSSPVSFLLDPRTHFHGRFYTGAKQKMSVMAILVNGTAAGTPFYMKSQGRHFMWPTSAGFDVRLADDNRVWARWRYARWSNASLTYTNEARCARPRPIVHVPKALALSPAKSARYLCHTAPDGSWCSAGVYSVLGGNVSLYVNLSQPRGVLPASLFFALTHGERTEMALGQPVVALHAAESVRCFSLVPVVPWASTLTLCTDDAVYFDMGETADVVLGSSFWQHNASVVQVRRGGRAILMCAHRLTG